MSVTLCIISLIVGFFVVHIIKENKKENQLLFQNDVDWEKEQSKFIADVVFHTAESVHKNTGWEYLNTSPGSIYSIKVSAENRGKDYIYRSYYRGYFEDDGGVTYPACNITKAYVEVREKD